MAVPHPQRRDRSGGTGRPDSTRLSRRRTAPLAEPAPQLSRKRTARRHALRRTPVRRSAGRLGRARGDHAVDTEHAVRTVEVLQRRALLHQQNTGSTSSFRRTGVSGRPAEPFRRSPPERRDEAGQSGRPSSTAARAWCSSGRSSTATACRGRCRGTAPPRWPTRPCGNRAGISACSSPAANWATRRTDCPCRSCWWRSSDPCSSCC